MLIRNKIISLFIFISSCKSIDIDGCYGCKYDFTDQEICLNKNDFIFKETTLVENIIISGSFSLNKDTLILNKNVNISTNHKFKNEFKLVIKDNKLYYIYNNGLSSLFFNKKDGNTTGNDTD